MKQLRRKPNTIQVDRRTRVLMADGRGKNRICSSPRPKLLAKANTVPATIRITGKPSRVARKRLYSGCEKA